MKTFRTLFSGGELFGVGATAAGWAHVDGYEIDARIAAVARQNDFDVRVADVCHIDYAGLPPVDHLHASPSCKNASQANQRGADGTRETAQDIATATATARAIAAHAGDTFSLENVWGYRTFAAFGIICAALRAAGFVYNYWHLNAADYGVPQTRKRLILLARRGSAAPPRPTPTHARGGDMFHAPWVGWYAAIEDILHTLPNTQPARWQLARMPEALRASLMLSNAKTEYGDGRRDADEPMFSITGQHAGRTRAFIVESTQGGKSNGWTLPIRKNGEPMFTVTNTHATPRAYIVGGGNTQAYLLGDQSAVTGQGVQVRQAADPAMVLRGSQRAGLRAAIDGRWVRMTVQALGRFQTVPDSYRGLTAEINGNGVPCLLAQRVMEVLG